MKDTNIRKKSVSPWNRMWEVLCPDCGKIRALKGRPRGLLVGRCHPCGVAANMIKKTPVPWHWAIGYGGVSPKGGRDPHGAPCIIVRCGLCNDPRLVLTTAGWRTQIRHCRRCSNRVCSTRWRHKPLTGDRRRSKPVNADSAWRGSSPHAARETLFRSCIGT